MKKVAIIGSAGQLGTDINKIFSLDTYYQTIPLSHSDIDIVNIKQTQLILEKIKPDIVINTAAYNRVDDAENFVDQSFLLNSSAQNNITKICQKNKWVIVYISTDYVFGLDKKRKIPYKELDNPGPVNTYGISKLAGEYFTKYFYDRFFIIRVCGLFGVAGAKSKGGNFIETMIRLGREKDKVNVVTDQILSPTYTLNIAENLKELLKTDFYGLYHMTSEGQCSWWDFAAQIFKLLNIKIKCLPVSSDKFKTIAKRPSYSVLEKYNLNKINLNKMNTWEENLKLYLKEKKYL